MNNIVDEVQEISLDGFQIVKGDLFRAKYGRVPTPTLSIWYNSISFAKASIESLQSCERVRIMVNSKTKGILVVPVTDKDPDSVRWCKLSSKGANPRKIDCIGFTSPLYENWKWDKGFAHRVKGRLVTKENKLMLYYDCTNPETWELTQKDSEKNNG